MSVAKRRAILLATRKARSHCLNNLPAGWENGERSQRATVNYYLIIDEDLKLAEVPAHHFNLGLEFSTEACRHPDGVNAGDSVDAVPKLYASH